MSLLWGLGSESLPSTVGLEQLGHRWRGFREADPLSEGGVGSGERDLDSGIAVFRDPIQELHTAESIEPTPEPFSELYGSADVGADFLQGS